MILQVQESWKKGRHGCKGGRHCFIAKECLCWIICPDEFLTQSGVLRHYHSRYSAEVDTAHLYAQTCVCVSLAVGICIWAEDMYKP